MKTSKRKTSKCQGHKLELVNTHVIKVLEVMNQAKMVTTHPLGIYDFHKFDSIMLLKQFKIPRSPDAFDFERKGTHSIF